VYDRRALSGAEATVGTEDRSRFERAIALIDAANADDPNTILIHGGQRPKELAHAEMLTAWVGRLRAEPGEPLLLAARAHHVRRWERPRGDYPEGRGGYLRWRIDAERFHADVAKDLLAEAAYDAATIERVGQIIRKEGLGRDAEVQVLEDGLCLVFLETQLEEVSGRMEPEKMAAILDRVWKKMSPAGRSLAESIAQRSALARPEDGGATGSARIDS
jgi:hypothetical protein